MKKFLTPPSSFANLVSTNEENLSSLPKPCENPSDPSSSQPQENKIDKNLFENVKAKTYSKLQDELKQIAEANGFKFSKHRSQVREICILCLFAF